jgi:hypothetical protein
VPAHARTHARTHGALPNVSQKLQATEAQIAEVEQELSSMKEKVANVGRQVFKDFSARLGIKDIHDFHERVAARQSEQGHRRQSILQVVAKATSLIKCVRCAAPA